MLHLNRNLRVYHENKEGRIIDSYGGREKIYVKGFYVAGGDGNLFSYDIYTRAISPDRDRVDHDALKRVVRGLLETTTSHAVIKKIVAQAQHKRNAIEFMDLDLQSDNAGIWRDSFERIYGQNSVLPSGEAVVDYEAEHRGYRIINLEENIAATLKKTGVQTAKDVAFDLALIPLVDRVLGLGQPVEIVIYDEAQDSFGRESFVPAFWSQGKVHMRRSILESGFETVRTYTHERGHHETREPDPSDGFRDFFEMHLAAFVNREIDGKGTEGPLVRKPEAFEYAGALKGVERASLALAEKRRGLDEEIGQYREQRDAYGREADRLRGQLEKAQRPWYKKLFRA